MTETELKQIERRARYAPIKLESVLKSQADVLPLCQEVRRLRSFIKLSYDNLETQNRPATLGQPVEEKPFRLEED